MKNLQILIFVYKICEKHIKKHYVFFIFYLFISFLKIYANFYRKILCFFFLFIFFFFFVFYSISFTNKININDYNHEKRIEWVRENNASDLKKLFIILSVFISGNIYLCANCNLKSDLFQFKGKIYRCNEYLKLYTKKKEKKTIFVLF